MSVSDPGHFLPNSATSSLSEGKKSSGRAVRWQKINHCLPGFEQKIIPGWQYLNKIDPCVPGFENNQSLCARIWKKLIIVCQDLKKKIILVCQDLNKIDPYVPGFEETNFRCGTCSCGRMCTSGRAWVGPEGSVVVRWVYRKSMHMKSPPPLFHDSIQLSLCSTLH